jgi:hypothetical protein
MLTLGDPFRYRSLLYRDFIPSFVVSSALKKLNTVKAPNFKLEQAKAVIGTSRAVGKMA